MRWWVYENYPTDKAVVHRYDCSHCNNGQGTQHKPSTRNGEWLGPFSSREDAFKAARETGRRDVRGCKVCNP